MKLDIIHIYRIEYLSCAKVYGFCSGSRIYASFMSGAEPQEVMYVSIQAGLVHR